MKRILVILFILAFLSCNANPKREEGPTRYIGLSAFAALNSSFPCDTFLASLNKSPAPAMAILLNTFGSDWSCVNKFLSENSNKPHLLEIHFSNEACRRNNRCGSEEFLSGLTVNEYNQVLSDEISSVAPKIARKILDVHSRIESNISPKTRLILSLGLEDNLTESSQKIFIR